MWATAAVAQAPDSSTYVSAASITHGQPVTESEEFAAVKPSVPTTGQQMGFAERTPEQVKTYASNVLRSPLASPNDTGGRRITVLDGPEDALAGLNARSLQPLNASDRNGLFSIKDLLSVEGLPQQIDIHQFGGRTFTNPPSTTTATTVGGTTEFTVTSNPDFIAGDGYVIPTAGDATTQNTPAEPTVQTIGASGNATDSYECVRIDSKWGLTAASPAGSGTHVSTVFGISATHVTEIKRTSNIVMATVSPALPFSSGNYHASIVDVTGGTTSFNGLQYITVTSSKTLTYSQAGKDESGTINAVSYAMLENAFILKRIQETAGSNQLVISTDVNHSLTVASGVGPPTEVFLNGISFPTDPYPAHANGLFKISSVTSNTFTVATPYTAPITATASASSSYSSSGIAQMTATVWAKNIVTCPAISGTTVQYAIYGRYGGGNYSDIGLTPYKSNIFVDWGPAWETGFVPPPAMNLPSTPPASAQNQVFMGSISAINGTRFTSAQTIPSTVTSVTIYHDDGIALQTALRAACSNTPRRADSVYLSPGNAASYYLFNAPFDISGGACPRNTIIVGNPLWINGTLLGSGTVTNFGNLSPEVSSVSVADADDSSLNIGVTGYGNPMIATGTFNSWNVSHVRFSGQSNGQIDFMSLGENPVFDHDSFQATGCQNASIPLVLGGGGYVVHLHHITWGGLPTIDCPLGQIPGAGYGQVIYMPVPVISIRGGPGDVPSVFMDDLNNGYGRGIRYDTTFSNTNYYSTSAEFHNVGTFQEPWQPFFTVYGNAQIVNVVADNVQMDSVIMPPVANVGGSIFELRMNLSFFTPGTPIFTGSPVSFVIENALAYSGAIPAQNTNEISFGKYGNAVWNPGTIYSAAGVPLPTCSLATKGFREVVSDATNPTYMGAYASGGKVTVEVICSYNGSTYSWVTH